MREREREGAESERERERERERDAEGRNADDTAASGALNHTLTNSVKMRARVTGRVCCRFTVSIHALGLCSGYRAGS